MNGIADNPAQEPNYGSMAYDGRGSHQDIIHHHVSFPQDSIHQAEDSDQLRTQTPISAVTPPLTIPQLAGIVHRAVSLHSNLIPTLEIPEARWNTGVKALTDILASAEPVIFGTCLAISEQAAALASALKWHGIWNLQTAALLSRIGLLNLPPDLLLRKCAGLTLTRTEQRELNRVPEISNDLLYRFPALRPVARIILYQSKHFDGSGFPSDNLSGLNIPHGSRVLKILIDAAELHESGLSMHMIFKEMRHRYGWYDSDLMDEIFSHYPRLVAIGRPQPIGIPCLLEELRAGQILRSNIETNDGLLVLSPGYALTDTLVDRLRRYALVTGIHEPIYVQEPATT